LSTGKRPRQKSLAASGWMFNFFQRTCEKAPNTGQWHLPCFITKDSVFKLYCQSEQDLHVSRSQFHELWTKFFKHVTIPAVSNMRNYNNSHTVSSSFTEQNLFSRKAATCIPNCRLLCIEAGVQSDVLE
jgi:hypothetical protein